MATRRVKRVGSRPSTQMLKSGGGVEIVIMRNAVSEAHPKGWSAIMEQKGQKLMADPSSYFEAARKAEGRLGAVADS